MTAVLSSARKLALARLHEKGTASTAHKLVEAMRRMESGATTCLTTPFVWSKLNWATEAGVNISTINKRRGGELKFAALVNQFSVKDVAALPHVLRRGVSSLPKVTDANNKFEKENRAILRELATQAEIIALLRFENTEYRIINSEFDAILTKNSELRSQIAALERKLSMCGLQAPVLSLEFYEKPTPSKQ